MVPVNFQVGLSLTLGSHFRIGKSNRIWHNASGFPGAEMLAKPVNLALLAERKLKKTYTASKMKTYTARNYISSKCKILASKLRP